MKKDVWKFHSATIIYMDIPVVSRDFFRRCPLSHKTNLVPVIAVFLLFSSCAQMTTETLVREEKLKVANWNVQTFFDAVTTGDEYTEFVKSGRWGKEAYIERLKRLCSVIKAIDADVFVMEEIENEAVVHDISNFLAGEWNGQKVYRNAVFAKDEGSSIGCAVLSRVQLDDMKVHSLDIRTEESDMPRLRPIMEVEVISRGRRLTILVNHWKSKSGGEEESEIWRNRQEGVLSSIMEKGIQNNSALLALGDFNRDIADFDLASGGKVVMRFWKDGTLVDSGVCVQSPWFSDSGKMVQPGSYYFQEEWSRIDNMFLAGKAEFIEFHVAVEGPWCDSKIFVPNRYQIWNGEGYSDHLPIVCVVRF